LADILPNLPRYIGVDASLLDVLKMTLYYFPQCIAYATPISLLFAVSYALGNLYAKNELVAIFNSGVSIRSFVLPLAAVGILLSIASFFFQDRVVIESTRLKNAVYQKVFKLSKNRSNANVIVQADEGRAVYQAYYYNDDDKSLQNLTVVLRDAEGRFLMKVQAEKAVWEDSAWTFSKARLFRWSANGEDLTEDFLASYRDPGLNEDPGAFRRAGKGIEEMRAREAKAYLEQRTKAGFPSAGEYADYYRRFAFSLTPFIVILLSSSLGGRFRKNILLASLVSSLLFSVVYYVTQMMTMLFAKLGYLPPALGAWIPFAAFSILGAFLAMKART
jgi:lipopolysaccharide export system permease protein